MSLHRARSKTVWWLVAAAVLLVAAMLIVAGLRTSGTRTNSDARASVERTRDSDAEASTRDTEPPLAATVVGRIESKASLVIRVLDDNNRPVHHARVVRLATDGGLSIAEWYTDITGRTGVSLPETGIVEYEADAPGFLTERIRVDAQEVAGDESVIRLRPATTIRGHVVWPTGGAVGAGCMVLAWPAGYVPDASQVLALAATQGAPTLLRCDTDAQGDFEFHVERGRGNYTLTAVGAGGVCMNRKAAPTDLEQSETTLVLAPLWRTEVELTDSTGGEPKVAPGLFHTGFGWDGDDVGLEPLVSRWLEIELAEHRASSARSPRSPWMHYSWYRSVGTIPHAPGEIVSGVLYAVGLPGYAAANAIVNAIPAGASGEPQRVMLVPTTTCRGSLRFKIENLLGDEPRAFRSRALGITKLFGDEGTTLEFAVEPGWNQVDGIPCGFYEVQFESYDGYFTTPLRHKDEHAPIIIEGNETVELSLREPEQASIEVEVRDDLGRSYLGGVMFLVRGRFGGTPADKFVEILKPPYILEMLLPGEYELHIEHVAGCVGMTSSTASLRVAAGEIAHATIEIRLGP